MRQPLPFGKYLLLERISVGGMAEVFKAKTFGVEGFEKLIAIKRILPSMAEDADFIQMFIDEAKICGQLNHANICQTFELGRIEDSHFIAMEYIWGKDLLQIQNRFRRLRRTMPVMMAAYIGSRVCEGLDYAHRKKDATGRPLNIIHRDVSPQNILCSYEGDVKVIDFGIAKAASRSSKTQAGVLKGKFGYMSPEHVRGLDLDRRSDIFSIGTILYEILTNERLFLGESDFATLEKIRNADVPPPSTVNPEVPPELDAIILKALAREADDRYQWANEMQEVLQNFLMNEETVYSGKGLAAWMREQFAVEMRREAQLLEEQRKIGREAMNQAPGRAAPPSVRLRPGTTGVPQLGARPAASGAGPPPAAQGEIATDDGDTLDPDAVSLLLDVRPDEDEFSAEKTAIAQQPGEELPNQATQIVNTEGGLGELPNQSTQIVNTEGGLGELPNQSTQIVNTEGSPGELPNQSTVVFAGDPSRMQRLPEAGPQPVAQPYQPVQQVPQYAQSMQHPAMGQGYTGSVPLPAMSGHHMPVYAPDPSMVMRPGMTQSAYMQLPQQPQPPQEGYGGSYARSNLLWKDILVGVAVATVVVMVVLGIRLLISPARGTIILTVLPPRLSDVHLDGKLVGKVQPGGSLLLRNVALSQHQLRVAAEDGEGQQMLSVTSAEPLQVTVHLGPRADGVAANTGTIRLRLPPEGGCLVSIDDRLVPEKEVEAGVRVAAGLPHKIVVSRSGKRDQTLSVTVAAGAEEVRQVEFVDTRGKLSLSSDPSGAEISVNGQARGRTPAVLDDMETDKPLRVVMRKRGYGSASKTLTLGGTAGAEQSLTLKLRADGKGEGEESSPTAAPTPVATPAAPTGGADGYLVANTKPWARVYIDGKDTNRTTPIAPRDRIPLHPGKHQVTFVTTNSRKYSFDVIIKPSEEQRLIKDLEQGN